MKNLLLLALLTLHFHANSQQLLNWKEIIPSTEKLHPDIKYYEAAGKINGDTVTAYYSITNIGNAGLVFYPIYSEINMKPESYLEKNKDIVFLTNAGYFGTNRSYSLVMNNYETLAPNARTVTRSYNNVSTTYYPTRSAFGIYPSISAGCGYVYTLSNNDTYLYPEPSQNSTDQAPLPQPDATYPAGGSKWTVSEAVGGGPLLVKDSAINLNFAVELLGTDITSSIAPRTAIGITGKNELINIVVDGRQDHSRGVSLQSMAEILLELGCIDAINLDGGGSSCIFIGDSLINKPSDGTTRAIPSVLALKSARQLNVDNTEEFRSVSTPVTTIDKRVFGFPRAAIFSAGSAGWFRFRDLTTAYYRIEFPYNPGDTEYPVDSIWFRFSGNETMAIAPGKEEQSTMLNMGIFPLSGNDSIEIFNLQDGAQMPVRGLRLINTSTGLPTVDLIPQVYFDTWSIGESLKLTYAAVSNHPGRLLVKSRVLEYADGTYRLLEEKLLEKSAAYIDSIEYEVFLDEDPVKLLFIVYDEQGDSSSVSYSINLDNSPPLVGFGKNSRLSGEVGDTLLFELRMYPANEFRPLDKLDVILFPESENTQLESFVPAPLGDTIFYPFPLKKEHDPGLIFRFLITDNKGYSSYQDYSIAVNHAVEMQLPAYSCIYYTGSNSLKITAPQVFGNGQLVIFDLYGRKIFEQQLSIESHTSVKLPEMKSGIYLYKCSAGDMVFQGKFVHLQ